MAQSKEDIKKKLSSSKKRHKQSEVRRIRNRITVGKVKVALRSLKKDIASGKNDNASTNLVSVYSAVDKAVKKGVFKSNKGSRIKSRTSSLVNKSLLSSS